MTRSAPDSPEQLQRLLLVTGLSGAGKSTVLAVLEDLGWETIDNFPIRLLSGLVNSGAGMAAGAGQVAGRGAGLTAGSGDGGVPLAIGFDSRTRGFVPAEIIALAKEMFANPAIAISFLFLDCADSELERRYNETRRRHPMAQGRPVRDGIAAERELLEPLRRWADRVIDTSDKSSNELQGDIRKLFASEEDSAPTLTVSSFGFARGMPPLADLVFDMRFLDNPHWVDGLRELTGQDHAVGEHIQSDPAFAGAYRQILDLLKTLIPLYAAQGKAYVHIAFGCTGGRHRSVFTAERMAQDLRNAGFSPTVRHRNLGSRAADELER